MPNLEKSEFFTLTELSEYLQIDRQPARENTINKGCPSTQIGNESFFVTKRFIEWLTENEVIKKPKSK